MEGVLAIKKPWPSMARTVWASHQRYMETYLDMNRYKGYYVCHIPCKHILNNPTDVRRISLLVTVQEEIMRGTIGSVGE